MNIRLTYFVLLTMFFSFGKSKDNSPRNKIDFGTNWTFTKDSTNLNWENITIPHTAHVEPLIVNNQWQGNCWYQKTFDNSTKNKKVFLYFEGVMHESWIWINGRLLKHHQGGYLPFTIDITSVILSKNNKIIVKVNNQDNPQIPPGKELKNLDFNFYGGIYRKVHLITTNKIYITDPIEADKEASGGIFVNFNNISKTKASGIIKIHIKNDNNFSKKVKAIITFKNKKNSSVFKINQILIAPNSNQSIQKNIFINNPQFWGIEKPNLYQVEIMLIADQTIIDIQKISTGIRKIELKPDGFYLNEELIYINGTNRHQEYPYIGYAIADKANYRDAIKIKNAGFDFVRTSHYPHSESFMNACDELGLLVMNCISGWQFSGDKKFIENSYQEIRNLARRDRNHPSVIFWEVSLNESDMKPEYMKKANEILRSEIPFEQVYTAGWIDNQNYDLFIPARQHAKPPKYWNDYENKNRKIFIAEYGDWEYYAQNAGFNQTAYENLKEDERTSRQLRAFGEKRLLQQAFNYQESFNSNLKGKNTIGHANWLMFDYNRGYANDIESSGISDIFRIPKFSYYFYQSQRSSKIKLDKILDSGPMIHIATYWNENSPLDIKVFSNCEEVELYLNDELIGKQKPTKNEFSDLLSHPPFVFKIPNFKKGVLKALGYIDNKIVKTHKVQTSGIAKKIELKADLSNIPINSEGLDVFFVYAKITDEEGNLVANSNQLIHFSTKSDNIELIGENPVKAEAGIATIICKTKKFKKSILINANSNELKSNQLELKP